jgi:glycosyltransferase involved in cell wall biosynthesis
MKVLNIGMHWLPEDAGGLCRYYYDCVNYLPQVGVELKGLLAGRASVAAESHGLVESFAPIESSLYDRYFGVRKAVKRHLSQDHYDLITGHFALYTFPVLSYAKRYPFVTHFHGPWSMECEAEDGFNLTNLLRQRLEKACYQESQQFIVLSRAFQKELHQRYDVPLEKIHVIPGGVDTDRFAVRGSKEEARLHLGWSQDRPIMFVVRRLAKRMGLENLIEAMQEVKRQVPDALLLIAGKGELHDSLSVQIQALGLADHVKLLGFISDDDLPIAYRAANFSIVPTVALEGFGLIVTESLASGTPVLGTPIGGIPEILTPLSPELVFGGTSPDHLTQGIVKALMNLDALPNAETCQAYAREHYDWLKISTQIKSVYELALAK